MSVETLKFDWPKYDCKVEVDKCSEAIRFIVWQHSNVSAFELDRNQADLLRLWLEEHLK